MSTEKRLTDPLVVGFVNVLVDPGVMFQTMNPVNEEIVEKHVQSDTQCQISPSVLVHIIIQHTLSMYLGHEPR